MPNASVEATIIETDRSDKKETHIISAEYLTKYLREDAQHKEYHHNKQKSTKTHTTHTKAKQKKKQKQHTHTQPKKSTLIIFF
jgi:hypothetical protein